MMKRVLATFAISTLMVGVPASASFANKPSSGDTCTSRGANKGGTCNNNGGGTTGGNTGNVVDACDNKANGTLVVVNGNLLSCNNFDVVVAPIIKL